MEAATTLFLQRGYLGTSVDQIAALAEVSKPTVYRFFADKEQLLTEIVLGTLDRRSGPFRAQLAALAESDDLGTDLRTLARDYIKIVTQPSGLALRRLSSARPISSLNWREVTTSVHRNRRSQRSQTSSGNSPREACSSSTNR